MEQSICKIKCKDGGNATGFFCIIPHPNKFSQLPVLMTNYHVINEEDKKIVFTLNNDKLEYEIVLNNSRKIYYSHNYDITIIEIKETDKLQSNSYLDIDDNIFKDNPNDIYMKTSIYLIGYPKGGISNYSMGIFKLLEEDGFTIRHLCQSDPGSSGCPIIKLNNNRVIGIHKGAHSKNNWNLGTFIKKPIEEFNKTKLLESNKFSVQQSHEEGRDPQEGNSMMKMIMEKRNQMKKVGGTGGGEGHATEGQKPDGISSSIKSSNNSLKKGNISKKDELSNPSNNEKDDNIEMNDNLNYENNPNIKSKIGDEKIYFSDKIIKINSGFFFKNKEIILLITNLAIYHFLGNDIQRRIPIRYLKAITISKMSNQIILHFDAGEYDILYIYEYRKKVIKLLQNLHKSLTGEDLLFCQKYEDDLSKFVAWKNEKSKNPYLFKIEKDELSSINEYLKKIEGDGKSKGGGFAAKMAALQKRMAGGSN